MEASPELQLFLSILCGFAAVLLCVLFPNLPVIWLLCGALSVGFLAYYLYLCVRQNKKKD